MKLKTSALCLIALTTILYSSYSQAQVAVPNGIQVTPEMIERGKGLAKGLGKKFGKKAAVEGAKKAAPALVVPLLFKPKKTIAAAAIVGGGAYWWYSTTMTATVKKISKNPEDFETYWEDLAEDFDKKLEFAQKTWDLYYENTGEEQKKYENLIVLLGYERPSLANNLTPIIINPKTKVEQDDLEKTDEFQLAMAEVIALAKQMDLKYEPLCKGQVGKKIREQLINLTPKDFKNLPLIKNNSNNADLLNVDSYDSLLKNGLILQNDHIPSYEALSKYFSMPVIRVKGVKVKNQNLEGNATALSIPKLMHRHNRTTGKGNIKVSDLDQYDLKIATFLDFSTLLAMKKLDKGIWETNKINYNDLFISFSYIYGRNAQLCLYY